MLARSLLSAGLLAAIALPACAQNTDDPFPDPIEASEGVIPVAFVEFAELPDIDGIPARPMNVAVDAGTERLFVNDMRGPIYTVSYDGSEVREYVDTNDPAWGSSILSRSRELGMQSFTLHPQFSEAGSPGYGRFYTWTDTDDTGPAPDFEPASDEETHHTVLLEWTASDPTADVYDGGPPRELARFSQPYSNHNGGHIAFNPLAGPGDPDFGMLYVGVGDGGSGGDPLGMSQDMSSGFGKILRIDPLGSNSANGEYGIPDDNPFVGQPGALGEIYALGTRNPQRLAWDSATGAMYMSDIGQNIVEEISPVPAGGNLGWNTWEGSFRFISRQAVDLADPRGDPDMVFPVAEYSQIDPLLQNSAAAAGLIVYRAGTIPALQGLIIFNDMPMGEIFYVSADNPPQGGQDPIRRILMDDGGEVKTLLDVVREKNQEQGRDPATRVDLRLGEGPNGEPLLLNKSDGVIRMLVP